MTRKFLLYVCAALLAASAMLIVVYFFSFTGGLDLSNSTWGEFGDYIGGTVGTCLAAITAIAVYLTYDMQRKQLEEQELHNWIELVAGRFDEAYGNYLIAREKGFQTLGDGFVGFSTDMKREKERGGLSYRRVKELLERNFQDQQWMLPLISSYESMVSCIEVMELRLRRRFEGLRYDSEAGDAMKHRLEVHIALIRQIQRVLSKYEKLFLASYLCVDELDVLIGRAKNIEKDSRVVRDNVRSNVRESWNTFCRSRAIAQLQSDQDVAELVVALTGELFDVTSAGPREGREGLS